jgi:hypothetical protein
LTNQTDFTPEAWQSILAAPAAIGALVMNTSFGLGNMIKETSALSQQIDALVQQPGDLPLLVALAADYKQKQEAKTAQAAKPATPATPAPEKQDPAVQKAQQMAGLQAAVSAVDVTATPQEAAQLKQWLYGLGDAVAKSAKVGT